MKCKAIILPTKNKSQILTLNGKLFYDYKPQIGGLPQMGDTDGIPVCQHLYILSDEVIKIGDYYFSKGESAECSVHLCGSERLENICKECGAKKIVATTDTTLELPTIDDESLKLYCENPSEYVEVDEKTTEDIERDLNIFGHDIGLTENEYKEYIKDNSLIKISSNNTISFKPVVEEETWDDVIKAYSQSGDISRIGLTKYLENNYNPPTKKI